RCHKALRKTEHRFAQHNTSRTLRDWKPKLPLEHPCLKWIRKDRTEGERDNDRLGRRSNAKHCSVGNSRAVSNPTTSQNQEPSPRSGIEKCSNRIGNQDNDDCPCSEPQKKFGRLRKISRLDNTNKQEYPCQNSE